MSKKQKKKPTIKDYAYLIGSSALLLEQVVNLFKLIVKLLKN